MHKTLIVVDNEDTCASFGELISSETQLPEVISFARYLNDYPKKNEPKTRIINLCATDKYLSKGYYCSLLAEAREHIVLPSVRTINTLRDIEEKLDALVLGKAGFDKLCEANTEEEALILFGQSQNPKLQRLATWVFQQYPAPVLKLQLSGRDDVGVKIQNFAISELFGEQGERFLHCLTKFTLDVWRTKVRKKHYRWDMAILVNPEESSPPSNREAIARFIRAAGKLGIQAEALSYQQIANINHYDALFLRETTAINHHTYRLAAKAETHGVITIDDTSSILRCCNKVYLQDAFSYKGVSAPKTLVVSDSETSTMEFLEKEIPYPMVLKMPEGSFSRGVFKVNNRNELTTQLQNLLLDSALVLAQEYLYTEFDWRIGILNGRAIYATKYMMARNHWQIYNHSAKRFNSGGFDTVPTFEVPKVVLDVAHKAASIIGCGLYGVDVKHIDGKAYVLEVNDNPSIEHKVEDAYLGDELYMQIMAEFQRRLEARGR